MIKIKIYTLLTPEAFEKLEEKLKDFLKSEGLKADIESEVTGNSIMVK